MVVLVVLGALQVVVVARDLLSLELAAREGARAAAVAAAPLDAARAAAERVTTIRPLQVDAHVGPDAVTVTVRATEPTTMPVIGAVMASVDLSAAATMALEPP